MLGVGVAVAHSRAELDVSLRVAGEDDFALSAVSSMKEIGRDLLDLVGALCPSVDASPPFRPNHWRTPPVPGWPLPLHGHDVRSGTVHGEDVLFTPQVEDRDPVQGRGKGFTHHSGDAVAISSAPLGTLFNMVGKCDAIAPWTYGAIGYLADYRREFPER